MHDTDEEASRKHCLLVTKSLLLQLPSLKSLLDFLQLLTFLTTKTNRGRVSLKKLSRQETRGNTQYM